MSWSETKSRDRVRDHIESIGDIEVKPLAREVTDLEAILSETKCREIFGAHVYCTVTNFTELSSDPTMNREEYRRLIQSTHIYQRELTRIAEEIFGEYRVHFQGSKIHVLCYLPVKDEAVIAQRAALFLLVANDFVRSVFNAEFSTYPDWTIGGGADIGNTVGTRNGKRADRELLFIGNPANYAAKIIVDTSSLRITQALYDALPEDVQNCCTLLKGGNYKIAAAQATLDALCDTYDVKWNRTKSAERIAEEHKNFPLDGFDYSDAEVLIDFEKLSENNNKRVLGASAYADVSAFTKFVEEAIDENAKADALKVFHVIRKELAKVTTEDHNGVRVQFQGDRIQALFHLPPGDANNIAVEAVEAAISMLSSFEQVIKKELPEAKPLAVKVGVDIGTTLATRLGKRGDRDNICLGVPAENAAEIEEVCADSMIGISESVYNGLDGSDRQKHFEYDGAYKCWVARGLTWERIDAQEQAQSYREKALTIGLVAGAAAVAGAVAYTISKPTNKQEEERSVQPSRTYAP
jgi:class 3 adenylate cyclase